MKKILVLIDGFNFYHRLKDYQYKYNVCVKWLSYKKLMQAYFKDYDEYTFEYIYYSAIANFKGVDTVSRHNVYIDALKKDGVKIVLGQFKRKQVYRCKCDERCPGCAAVPDKKPLLKHEEKNTDVNIAITLVEKAILKQYDKCYILSSDSDFNTAIARAKELHPGGIITLVPPPIPNNKNRKSKYFISDVKKLTQTKPLFVSWKKIETSQFPDNFGGLQNPWIIS